MNVGWAWRDGWGARRGALRGFWVSDRTPLLWADAVLQPSESASFPVGVSRDRLVAIGLRADRRIRLVNGTAPVNEVITLAVVGGVPTAGQVSVQWSAGGSGLIPWNATAAQVQAGLEAASWIGAGNMACTGGPWPTTPVVATFVGTLAGVDIPDASSTHYYTMLWDAGVVTVTETVRGGPGAALDTLVVQPTVPLVWVRGVGPCPFMHDLATLRVENLGARTARVRLAIEVD